MQLSVVRQVDATRGLGFLPLNYMSVQSMVF